MKIFVIKGNHKEVIENAGIYASLGLTEEEQINAIDNKFAHSNYLQAIKMIWLDLNRAFFIPSNGKNFNDYSYSWVHDLHSSAYKQENMSASDPRLMVQNYVLYNPNFIEAHPAYKNIEMEFLTGDGERVFNFGYFDDNGSPCAFNLTYAAKDTSIWVASFIKNTTSAPEDRLVTIITPEKMIYRPENSIAISNNKTISTINTQNLQNQLVMSLNSTEIAKQLSGMMTNDGSVNMDRLEELSKIPEHASHKLNEEKKDSAIAILNRSNPTNSWEELSVNDANQHFKDYLISSIQKTNNMDEIKKLSSILTDVVVYEYKQEKLINSEITLKEFIDQSKSEEEKEIISTYIESRDTQLSAFIKELNALTEQLPGNALMQEILDNATQLNPLNSFREENIDQYITEQRELKIKNIQTEQNIEKNKIVPPPELEDKDKDFFQRNLPDLIITGLSFLAIVVGVTLTLTGIFTLPGIILTGIGAGVAATIGGVDIIKMAYNESVHSDNSNAYYETIASNQAKDDAINESATQQQMDVDVEFNQIKEILETNPINLNRIVTNDVIITIDPIPTKYEEKLQPVDDVVIPINLSLEESDEEKAFNEIDSALKIGEQAIEMANADPDRFVFSKKSVVFPKEPIDIIKESKKKLNEIKSTSSKQDEAQSTDEQTKSPNKLGH